MEHGAWNRDQVLTYVSSTVDSRLTALFWMNTRPISRAICLRDRPTCREKEHGGTQQERHGGSVIDLVGGWGLSIYRLLLQESRKAFLAARMLPKASPANHPRAPHAHPSHPSHRTSPVAASVSGRFLVLSTISVTRSS